MLGHISPYDCKYKVFFRLGWSWLLDDLGFDDWESWGGQWVRWSGVGNRLG